MFTSTKIKMKEISANWTILIYSNVLKAYNMDKIIETMYVYIFVLVWTGKFGQLSLRFKL